MNPSTNCVSEQEEMWYVEMYVVCGIRYVVCGNVVWTSLPTVTVSEQEERRAEMLAETQAVPKKEDQQQVKHFNVEILSEV